MDDTYGVDDGMPAPSEYGGSVGPGSPDGPASPGGPGGHEASVTHGGQQSVVDPDGNYIHLFNDESQREVTPVAAVYLRYSANAAERERALETALHAREDRRGVGGYNPWIADFFIPESFKQWLADEGRVEFVPYGGRRFVRAVPLSEATGRHAREKIGHGPSDAEISRRAQGTRLLSILIWLANRGEHTFLHQWCMWTAHVRRRGLIRQAERGPFAPGEFPPPSDYPSPQMYAGQMSPRPPHGYGPRRRPPPPPPPAYHMPMSPQMAMDPERLMHLGMGGMMPPPPEYYGHGRRRRGPRRPSFSPHGFGPRDPRFHDFYGGGGYY
ncbi:hypothetical protein PVAR5_2039 [Paecilomyces variotii No. 5]|uniref:Uncharacterized protein n=1 Tax=Byssochlamys spectabilis (strain No. 5 / NBRC 109023) TaxID=1356009 RepID=V5FAL4_BYSSN|nr:hypothetical protein PVAR5_2039 [Paecilomyces variotii No. 5]